MDLRRSMDIRRGRALARFVQSLPSSVAQFGRAPRTILPKAPWVRGPDRRGLRFADMDRLVQRPSPMPRTNLCRASTDGTEPTRPGRLVPALSSDDLLDPPTDLTLELMEDEPANCVTTDAREELSPELTSGIRRRDAIAPPTPWSKVEELSSADLEEEPGAPAWSEDGHDKTEELDILCTGDLEELAEQQVPRLVAETVLFCCKAGDTLPACAEYADELPRFAMSSGRRRPGQFIPATRDNTLGPLPSAKRPPSAMVVRANASQSGGSARPRAELVRAGGLRKVPPVRLPSFRIEEHPPLPRPRVRAPGLPKFIID